VEPKILVQPPMVNNVKVLELRRPPVPLRWLRLATTTNVPLSASEGKRQWFYGSCQVEISALIASGLLVMDALIWQRASGRQ
jgi:hypothetical protein